MAKSNQNPVVVVPDYSMASGVRVFSDGVHDFVYYRGVRIWSAAGGGGLYVVPALWNRDLTCCFSRLCDAKAAVTRGVKKGII